MGNIPHENSCKTHQEKLLLEVHDKLSVMLGGNEYVAPVFVLPHNQIPGIFYE